MRLCDFQSFIWSIFCIYYYYYYFIIAQRPSKVLIRKKTSNYFSLFFCFCFQGRQERVNDGYFEDVTSKGIFTEVGVGKLSAVSGLPTLALKNARQSRFNVINNNKKRFNEQTLALRAWAINFEMFTKRRHAANDLRFDLRAPLNLKDFPFILCFQLFSLASSLTLAEW